MKTNSLLCAIILVSFGIPSWAQLQIVNNTTATALAQKLVGEGVIISNATLTNNTISTGFFYNRGGTNIGMDSGIVLTNGRAKSNFAANQIGLDGNGFSQATAVRADANLNLPGDADLAAEIGQPVSQLNDAIALEFDFIPLGDSIKFNYIMSSEEYTTGTVCVFFDAFAFFISGPGITGLKNIALIPGTATPVTIRNVNNITTAGCVNNPQYYRDNNTNVYFTHEGHTALFTAKTDVQPCQTYHLKLVIADKGDHQWDSGVFLEAGSLRSDPIKLEGVTPLNELNLPYLAEGCAPGSIHITRNSKKSYPLNINLAFGGTAINGSDVATIPSTAIIPANDSVVVIPITTIADMIPEGTEVLKIYVGNNCSGLYSDSIKIEIRDIGILGINPSDTVKTCRNSNLQLQAEPGYLNYSWSNSGSLSSGTINDPIATPTTASTNYVCTATTGNCVAVDSVLIQWKTISLVDKTDILCKNGTSGSITIEGSGWDSPASYAIDHGAFQPGNTFSNLPVGNYQLKMKDASGCVDSLAVDLVQAFPDLNIATNISPATCSITPDGQIEVIASGGNGSYNYSSDGITYQTGNVLVVPDGTHTVYVKDGNDCIANTPGIVVPKTNTVTLDAGPDQFICEGASYMINAVSNASTINWSPTTALTGFTTLTPTISTNTTIKYYVTAEDGVCTRTDSVIINVWPAPVANAGEDVSICYGITAQLNGSGALEYEWSDDPTFVSSKNIADPIVKPSVTTSYYLHVKDNNGCRSLQPDEIKVIVTPAVKVFAGRDTLVAVNQPLQLNAIETNNSGVTDWEWTGPAFLDNPFIASPIATYPSPQSVPDYEYIFTVTGTTPVGCQGSDEIRIKVYNGPEIYVPSAFTPNGDGKNDYLTPLPVGIKEFKYFRVYNRWGQIIFSTQNPSKGWDGKIAGNEQATGVYIYMTEAIDYTGKLITRKGSITLIR